MNGVATIQNSELALKFLTFTYNAFLWHLFDATVDGDEIFQ